MTETVTIASIAAGGDGVARDRLGRVLFVPRTAPGDVVEIEHRAASSARFARARLQRVLTAGDARVSPRCAHYGECGGCQLQHLGEDAQRDAKARIVADAFGRLARRPIALPEVVPSPEPWAYRRKASFTIRADVGGFHAADDPDRVVSIEECPITEPAVVEALLAVRTHRSLLPRDREWRASVRRLDARALGLVVEGGQAGPWSMLDRFAQVVPMIDAIWWRARDSARALLMLDRRPASATDAAPAFAQVNAPLAARLHADVVDHIVATHPQHVVDAYAGVGAIAGALAAHGVRVTAIELDPTACEVARRTLPPAVTVIEDDVARALVSTPVAEAIVVNPPRAGLAAPIPPLLDARAGGARHLVYVSCDPSTLARDVARLTRWRIEQVRCYDLFPQTAHVETVVSFVPADMEPDR
ncbi:MAG: hypothetical protein MUE41_11260 [Gemmatimonadaceae bacterium]|nr:hypothetical protein [Gemmatimonadaceae bacterium]